MSIIHFTRHFSPLICKRIHKFFFIEIDPFILGLYRIFMGLYFILYLVMLAPSWLKYYGPNGLMPENIKSIQDYQLFDSILMYTTSDTTLLVIYGISIIFALCLVLGLLWRIPIIWLWILNFSIVWRNLAVHNSEEQVMALLLFFSLFLPLNSALSLQSYFKKRKIKEDKINTVKVWALRPLQINIVLIFLFSIPHKLILDVAWRNGTVIHYLQHNTLYSRWPDLNIFTVGNGFLSRVMTFYTLAIQSIFPFLIWFRKFTVPLVLGSIFLHLGIALLVEGITMFNLAMIPALILFLPSNKTRLFFSQWKNKINVFKKLINELFYLFGKYKYYKQHPKLYK